MNDSTTLDRRTLEDAWLWILQYAAEREAVGRDATRLRSLARNMDAALHLGADAA